VGLCQRRAAEQRRGVKGVRENQHNPKPSTGMPRKTPGPDTKEKLIGTPRTGGTKGHWSTAGPLIRRTSFADGKTETTCSGQLRENAKAEEDPQTKKLRPLVKENLWKEYHRQKEEKNYGGGGSISGFPASPRLFGIGEGLYLGDNAEIRKYNWRG